MDGRARRWLVVLLAVVVATLAGQGRPDAAERGELSIDAGGPVAEETFPPLSAPTPNSGTALVNPTVCAQTALWCDTFTVAVDPTGVADAFDAFDVHVIVTWPRPRTDQDPGGNVLTVSSWEADLDPTYCPASVADGDAAYPAVVAVGSDNPEPGVYQIVVANVAGSNLGYSVRAQFTPVERRTLPTAEPSSPGRTVTFQDRDPLAGVELPPEPGAVAPVRRVLAPGADGPAVTHDLPTLASGTRLPLQPRGFPWAAAVVAGLGGVILAAAGVTLRRHRAVPALP